uniref:tRNA-binding domain-containing protein n=1 Tax=Chlamydomonas leiostraca TaxID=1034604 RepID=A0A7S0X374_9CHLO|mmetsp:Transcript_9603/g.23813  ORF Transcript_9603/g.23813 Transcript_9603/m.23813 type:complete len:249 (+) Transcript_9603:134-880(+)|eukprot:CAMPEP_0202861538 /NCGR_PEP_ID=MMETSP1391-20130828/2903_1 /ASSEMBLY_ACC=CAM_ASM_000867 /TAXON_ID=1034604 /ORGANISM="Chlamydomonas leiostraca, Strain SAG 11-49" /LENGTH=248 /DNA_ID=CAMNT_0049540947 /DNA_START=142 /DNA_END=888 /DNA_ORIENTATION=+
MKLANVNVTQRKGALGSCRATPVVTTAKPVRGAGWQLRSDIAEWQSMRLRRMQCPSTGESEPAVAVAEAPAKPAEAPKANEASIEACDIRVGKIVKCEKHPEADSLYVEQIDVGEPEPRTIVSGLVSFVPIEQMQDRNVIVICNLKPRNMRGIKSNGMVLCASNDAHDKVEPLNPPADAKAGERVWFGDDKEQPAPAEPNRVQKKKIWETVQPDLKTDGSLVAGWKGRAMHTSAGPVTVTSLANSSIA